MMAAQESGGAGLDLSKIPRERWAGALYMVLANGFRNHPLTLFEIIDQGEERFVRVGRSTDRYGLTERDYKEIFRRLKRLAGTMGHKRLRRH